MYVSFALKFHKGIESRMIRDAEFFLPPEEYPVFEMA